MSLSKKIDLQMDFAAGVLSVGGPSPPMTPYSPLKHCKLIQTVKVGDRGRANQREDWRANSSQSRSKIPTWLTVSPVYELYKTPVMTTFKVWCLCSYLVHDCFATLGITRTPPPLHSPPLRARQWAGQGQVGVAASWTAAGAPAGRPAQAPDTSTQVYRLAI